MLELLNYLDLPVIVALILYEKWKTNGQVRRAVENNTEAIRNIYNYLNSSSCHGRRGK